MKRIFVVAIILTCSSRLFGQFVNSIDVLSPPDGEIKNLSQIAVSIDYIPLQTKEESLIKRINSIKTRGDLLYILDLISFNHSRILCFDVSGRFRFSLDKPGKGPDEYQYISDFDINYENSKVAVLSNKEVLIYTQTASNFILDRRIKLNSSPKRINFIGKTNNLFLQYSNSDGSRVNAYEALSPDGIILCSWPNYLGFVLKDGFITAFPSDNISYIQDNSLFLKELQNDTLFSLTDNMTLKPVLIFRTGDKRITPEVRSRGRSFSENTINYIIIRDVFSSKRYTYYSLTYKTSTQLVFDKESGEKFNISAKDGLIEDISGGISFTPKYCNNGIFYSWVDAITFKNYSSSDSFASSVVRNPDKKGMLKMMADSISEMDNPILILVKIL